MPSSSQIQIVELSKSHSTSGSIKLGFRGRFSRTVNRISEMRGQSARVAFRIIVLSAPAFLPTRGPQEACVDRKRGAANTPGALPRFRGLHIAKRDMTTEPPTNTIAGDLATTAVGHSPSTCVASAPVLTTLSSRPSLRIARPLSALPRSQPGRNDESAQAFKVTAAASHAVAGDSCRGSEPSLSASRHGTVTTDRRPRRHDIYVVSDGIRLTRLRLVPQRRRWN
jgi:hypothetical protein